MKSIFYIFLKNNFFRWWRGASLLPHVKSQEEFELANKELKKSFEYKFPLNTRTVINNTRYVLFNSIWKYIFGKFKKKFIFYFLNSSSTRL